MLQRESALIQTGNNPPRGLVYPVVYSDGDHFHPRAKETQYRAILVHLPIPIPAIDTLLRTCLSMMR